MGCIFLALEYQKQELTFQLNSFNKPDTLTKYNAWADLILKLLIYEKGTFPDLPEMGLEINKAHYQDLKTYSKRLKSDLEFQLSTYLPDIPVASVDVYGMDNEYGTLLVIGIEIFNDNGTTQMLYLKGSKSESTRMFDFEINFE